MFDSKRMFKRHLRELSKSFGSQIDPEKSEELKRTKTDIENNLTRVLRLIKSEDQSKKDGTELVGLIEDFYNQYQSLYVLYSRLTGEYAKAAPRRGKRVSSLSSSSSDSEYFSSEDAEVNTDQVTDSYKKPFYRENRESYSAFVNNTLEVLKTQASTEASEFEEQLNTQTKELENLNQQKRKLELEVKQLRGKNAELEGAVSVLHAKLQNNEDQAMSKTADFMARINKLEQEAKSLRSQKGKLEEKIKRSKNETLNQKKDFTVMQQNLASICNTNKELEAQLENERKKVSQHLIRIKILEENLAETASIERILLKEKESLGLKKIEDLESQCSSKENDLEDQLRDSRREINRLADEGNALQDRNHELERAMILKEEEISQLETKAADHEGTIKKLTETIDQTRGDQNKQRKIWSKKLKLNQQLMEKKIEELAEGFRKKMEDNIRILHRRIHVAEQLNNENKDSQKITKQRYEKENKMLGEKIGNYEDEIMKMKEKVDELEEKELVVLREKVWKLEGDVSKEGGEKLNLMKAVTQLERRVGKLENNLKEKDEELVSLGEKKREAIRQLCFLVEFHRDRCLYLKDLMLKTRRVKNETWVW